jgi:hypothetical protein
LANQDVDENPIPMIPGAAASFMTRLDIIRAKLVHSRGLHAVPSQLDDEDDGDPFAGFDPSQVFDDY